MAVSFRSYLGLQITWSIVAISLAQVLRGEMLPEDPKIEYEARSTDQHRSGPWAIPVYHRDDPLSPFRGANLSRHELLVGRLKRDLGRVKAISHNLRLALNKSVQLARGRRPNYPRQSVLSRPASIEETSNFSSPIASVDGGEYFTMVGLGTPARDAFVILDTGSDISWVQCLPCQSCYQQFGPIFDPTMSSTFRSIPCPSSKCQEIDNYYCTNGRCQYSITYNDGSNSIGLVGTERFVIGNTVVQNVDMGCGHHNEGLYVGGPGGLLALGGGSSSFVSQASSQIEGVFSYCLSDSASASPGASLMFGEGAVGEGATFVSLIRNPMTPTFYYVPLTGISMGGSSITGFSASDLALKPSGEGGVMIDSGTTLTRLVSPVYTALREALSAEMERRELRVVGGFDSILESCFDLGEEALEQLGMLPPLGLDFAGGVRMEVEPVNYLLGGGDEQGRVYCLAFAESGGGDSGGDADLSILGNVLQQGFRVSFNLRASKVGFEPHHCTSFSTPSH